MGERFFGGQERESNVEVSVSIWMFTILFSVIVRKRDAMARCSVSELIITTTTTRTTTTLTIKPKKKKKKKKKKEKKGQKKIRTISSTASGRVPKMTLRARKW